MRGRLLTATALLAALAFAGCSGSEDGEGRVITVLAAASLTESFTRMAEEFEDEHPGVRVDLAFDSSATLAAQALEGAPADVLATADPATMDRADAALAGEPAVFATNTLVLVVPRANPAGIEGFEDVADGDVTYVVCVETAPCGSIWRAVAADQGVTAEPASLEVDVKAVLAKVTADEADAGFVYATDAEAAGELTLSFPVPGAEEHVTEYPLAVLEQAREPDLAREFVDLVLSDTGRRVLAAAGFGAP